MKYQPVKGVMLRASYGTAFLPPTYSQLAPPVTSTTFSTITDPRRGNASTSILTITGGNPNLKPQSSNDTSVGLVLEPERIKGLRIDVEWYRIRERDVIGSLSAQVVVNNESEFPDRVLRAPVAAGDTYGVGTITAVNTTSLNLTELISQGMDVSVNYRRETPAWGTFDFNATGTQNQHYKRQLTLKSPFQDLASWVHEGGPIRFKGNGTLTWEYGRWTTSWSAEYYYLFRVNGTPGDPTGSTSPTVYLEQGASEVPAEWYHTVTVNYRFPTPKGKTHGSGGIAGLLEGVDVTFGVKNVFNHTPPFDASFGEDFYAPFGDIRLRDYWVSVRKRF
jgi:outer membrane receptor protein involved in Fe transport